MFLFLQSNVIGFYALKVALIDINTPPWITTGIYYIFLIYNHID